MMAEREIYIMQFYRVDPGDVDIKDMPTLDESLPEAEKALAEALLSFNLDEKRLPSHRPHHARLAARDGSIPVCLMALPGGKVARG
jgi:hypothetical protein